MTVEQRIQWLEAMVRALASGESFSNRQIVGTGTGGSEDRTVVEMAAGSPSVSGAQLIFRLPGIDLADCPRIVGGSDGFHLLANETGLTELGIIQTKTDQMVYSPDIVLTATSSTTWDITNAHGDELGLSLETIVLVRGGLIQRPSGTVGSIDSGTSFTVDVRGSELTTATAPGVSPGINFFILQAKRKVSMIG